MNATADNMICAIVVIRVYRCGGPLQSLVHAHTLHCSPTTYVVVALSGPAIGRTFVAAPFRHVACFFLSLGCSRRNTQVFVPLTYLLLSVCLLFVYSRPIRTI